MKRIIESIRARLARWALLADPNYGSRNKHLLVLIFLCAFFAFIYYADHTPLGNTWPFDLSLFRGPRDLQRTLFLIPIIYSAFVFYSRGVVITSAVFLTVAIPRALLISPFPDSLIRSLVFVLAAFLIGMLLSKGLERRRVTEQKLIESQKNYEVLFDSGNDAVFVQFPTPAGLPGKFVEVNNAACKLLGYDRKEFRKLTPMDVTDVSTWVKSPSKITKDLLKGRTVVNQPIFVTKNGMRIPAEVTLKMFEYKGKTAIIGVGRDIRERKKLDELKRKNEQHLRDTAIASLQAQEEEREVISMEIHDRSLQLIISIYQQLDTLESLMPEGSKEQKIAGNLLEQSKIAIRETRNIMKELFPETLDKFGLIALIKDELERHKKEQKCDYELTANCPDRLPWDAQTILYRIFHEALLNIKKHAQSVSLVRVSVSCPDRFVELVVADNGSGFVTKRRVYIGLPGGLANMRRRAEIAGGSFGIESSSGKGTTIKARIPLSTGKKKLRKRNTTKL